MKRSAANLFAIALIFALIVSFLPVQPARAATTIFTQWNFESPNPADATGATYPIAIAPAIGTGNAGGVHASASTAWSTPVGNGSTDSFSSNTWAVGDYYLFQTSTLNFTNIQVTWDQTSSGTGPKDFKIAYSTDGTNFTDFGSPYTVLANASPNAWSATLSLPGANISRDLSTIMALNNQANIYFRLIDNSTTSASNGTVASGGTDRVDNFTVSGTPALIPTNPSGIGTANPNTLSAGDPTLLIVTITPGTNPTSTGLTVTCDLSTIGGVPNQAFLDDGLNGDITAGDNIFSYSAIISASITNGAKSLACTIADAESRSGSTSISLTVQAAPPSAGSVVISQVYGGGGNSGALYKNDFVELYNRSPNPVEITGWTVQYASSTGASWTNTALSGTIQPGYYYLVQEAAGAGGTLDLPTPDATGSIAMSGTSAKVALVNNSTVLSVSCPTGLMDFVGYGAANCSEASPTAALSNTTAALRKLNGAQDTNNNSADFNVSAPNPRNSLFPFAATGLATPAAIVQGETSLLTVTVSPGINPASTNIAVACNLNSIGGSVAQTMYDNGTNGDQTAGDNIFSFVTTDSVPGTQSLSCDFSDAQGRAGRTKTNLTLLTILPIGTVNGPVLDTDNGATHLSTYVGQLVTVRGVIFEKTLQAVSNSINTYKGFYIQNTSATADGDPNTSDGLFVFMNSGSTITGSNGAYTPTVGDEVIISGTITEYFNMTELQAPALVLVSQVRSGVDLETEIAPVVANPPVSLADANRYWERLQGMRVQVPAGSITLGGRNVFSPADAEIWLARPDSTIAQRANVYAQKAYRDAHPLDDNYDPTNWDGNGYRILIGSLGIKAAAGDGQALIAPARAYSTLPNATVGGLNYTFSKYRVEVDAQPAFSEGPDPAANNPPQVFDRSIYYTIADYNLENLYDFRDNPFSGCDFTGNAGCPLVAPFLSAVTPPYDYVPANNAVYQARLNDIALQIANDLHNPDILMVQEVENQDICTVTGGALICGITDNADGKPDVLQELALKIAANGGPVYDAAFDRDSSDLRGIAPAFLYRTDRVQLVDPTGDPVLGADPAIIYPGTTVPHNSDVANPKTLNAMLPAGITACETSWVFPRAPDVGLFRIYSTSIGEGSYRDVYVIDNHFKSGPDTCVGHRTEQAKYNAALVAFIQAAKPDARIVVGGDLNVYPRPDDPFAPIGQPSSSDQLGSLYDPSLGLKNLWEVLLGQAPEAAYSYVYLGMAQTLDQMFVNQPLLADLQQFRIAHINSDFAADYPDDVARGTSDHDPNVGNFVINDPPTVNAGGPYTINEGSSVTLTATGTDPEGQPLTYTWDLDNNGTFETTGQSVSFNGVDGPSTLTVNVQVTDNGGLTATDSTTVIVNNVAPVAGAITAPTSPVKVSIIVSANANFTDKGVLDTHTATWDWGDGTTSTGSVTESNGSGLVTGSHSYTTAGLYIIKLTVNDKDGASGQSTFQTLIVYNPQGGFVTGGGWFNSPLGAYYDKPTKKGPAVTVFVVKYLKNASVPSGSLDFIFAAGSLQFRATNFDWLIVDPTNKTAQFQGSGKINGSGNYKFMVWASDKKTDTFRIKIMKSDGTVVYDNGSNLPLYGGVVVINK